MFRLNTIENINSALAQFRNNKDVRPEKFYSTILLDTITLPTEDYVHVEHATRTINANPAHQKTVLTRLGTWTPHTEVLMEGIPPRPDQTRSESIEFGYTQFGRVAYYTDQIRTDVLQDFVAHYTKQLADLANATLDKYAREKLLSAPSDYFAGAKHSLDDLVPGDVITIADLRLLVLRFQRMFVNPIAGNYNYICSPEFIYDLLDDPYIQQYMNINQSTFGLFESGKPFDLFKVKYIETRFDENLAPDLDHPGEYMDADGNYWLRLISEDGEFVFSIKSAAEEVVNNESDVAAFSGTSQMAKRAVLKQYYYKDGSAIENRVYWKINTAGVPDLTPSTGNTTGVYAAINGAYEEITDLSETYATNTTYAQKITSLLGSVVELPINRGILTGANGLVRIIVEGQGSAEIITKGLGSAGTNDPLDQLSSVGFKLRGVGFGFERPEAVVVTYSVPYHALFTAGLSAAAILGSQNHVPEKGNILNVGGTDKYQSTTWTASTPYKMGQHLNDGTNEYVVLVDYTSGATSAAADATAGNLVKLGAVIVNNPTDLNIKKGVDEKKGTNPVQIKNTPPKPSQD